MLRIDLTKDLLEDIDHRLKWLPYAPILTFIAIYLFVMGNLWLVSNPQAFITTGALVSALAVLGYLLAYPRLRHGLDLMRKARSVVTNERMLFEISETEIKIPLLLLTNPAFTYATNVGMTSLIIPLSDVTSCELHRQGNQNGQFIFKLKADSAKWGKFYLPLLSPRFGIKRKFLYQHEATLLLCLKEKFAP